MNGLWSQKLSFCVVSLSALFPAFVVTGLAPKANRRPSCFRPDCFTESNRPCAETVSQLKREYPIITSLSAQKQRQKLVCQCFCVCAVVCASLKAAHITFHPVCCFLFGAEASVCSTNQNYSNKTDICTNT